MGMDTRMASKLWGALFMVRDYIDHRVEGLYLIRPRMHIEALSD